MGAAPFEAAAIVEGARPPRAPGRGGAPRRQCSRKGDGGTRAACFERREGPPAPGEAPLIRPLRHEWAAWLILGLLLAWAAGVLVPQLKTRFSFRELFPLGHPARDAYELFQEDFGQGSKIFLYFHGPGVFQAPFLGAADAFGHVLRRLPGAEGVLSAVDLVEPRVEGRHQMLSRILRPRVLADPAALAAALAGPPFREHLQGFLYDRDLRIFVMLVTPPLDDSNPLAARRFMESVQAEAQGFAAAQGVGLHIGGDFFLRHEVRRVAYASQARVLLAAFGLFAGLFYALFGSLLLVVLVFLLLGASVFLSFAAMALLEIPVTFLSINTAIMVLVIGVADLIHITGRYASLRSTEEPDVAAARASRETALPVLLTSLTTAGCLLVTAATPLNLVRQFTLALSAGVMVAWALAVTYAPLLLRRSRLVPGRGLYFRLHRALRGALDGPARGWVGSRWNPRLFAGVAVLCLVLLAHQEVDSNWFRSFGPTLPITRTIDFLDAQGFPKTTVDCTLRIDQGLTEALEDPRLERDARALAAVLARQPGVLAVEHLYTQLDFVRAQLAQVRYPRDLDPRWHQARRDAILRQYLVGGLFRRYFGARRNQLRFVALTRMEASRDFQDLEQRVLAAVRGLPLEVARVEDFAVAGQMHYWSAIMNAIPSSFLEGLAGCLVLVYLGFYLLTGSASLALLALAPNLFPIAVMLGVGLLFGIPLNENLIFSMSLAIGVAVDDTLHFLFHYRKATGRGRSPLEAVQETVVQVGAPIVVTSLLLLAGFGICLVSEVTPLRQMGILLCLAISAALVADLLLLPALLLRYDRPGAAGQARGYSVEHRGGAPRRAGS